MFCCALLFLVFSFFSLNSEEYPYCFEGKCEGWGHKPIQLISLFLPSNPVIVQAGGHHGSETADLALLWPFGRIIAFEPNPHAFKFGFARTSYLENVEFYPLGLHDQEGEFDFYVCLGESGTDRAFEHASSLLKPSSCMELNYQGPIEKVECVILDEWCKVNKVDHIDFLRLDTQGSELAVLLSSPEILRTIKVIHVETFLFPFREGITRYAEMKQFLERSGFSLLSYWYREGLNGSAVFVRNTFYH